MLKNVSIRHSFSIFQPHVHDNGEQDFLMSQLESLNETESKNLLHSFLHRVIDLRIRGQARDVELLRKDEEERVLRKEYKKMRDFCVHYERNVRKLDKNSAHLSHVEKENSRLKKEVELWKGKTEKYKKFYILHSAQVKKEDSSPLPLKSLNGGAEPEESMPKNVKYQGNKLIFEHEATGNNASAKSRTSSRHNTRHK